MQHWGFHEVVARDQTPDQNLWLASDLRWLKLLKRRSQRARLSWERFTTLTNRFSPPHAGICAGRPTTVVPTVTPEIVRTKHVPAIRPMLLESKRA